MCWVPNSYRREGPDLSPDMQMTLYFFKEQRVMLKSRWPGWPIEGTKRGKVMHL